MNVGPGLLVLLFCSAASAFNYKSYTVADLDSFIAGNADYLSSNPDLTVAVDDTAHDVLIRMNPDKYCVQAYVDSMPRRLKSDIPVFETYLKSIGIQEPPEISYSMLIRSKGGKRLHVVIQSVLVLNIIDELREGAEATLYLYHFYDHRGMPGLLLNEFMAGW